VSGWRSVALSTVAASVETCLPERDFKNQLIKYIDLTAVDNIAKDVTYPRVIPSEDAPSRARQRLRTGDILVSTVRPNLNAVAVVGPKLDGAIGSTGFCVLRARPGLDFRYLFHWVKSSTFVAEMTRLATGASYPAVSNRIVFNSLIPLPPIEEQRRIAAILDKADEIRIKRRAALAQLDTLTQSIFLDVFGDPISNPKGWPDQRVDGALAFLTYGHRFYDQPYTESGTPIVRITDLDDFGALDFSSMPRMTLTEHERAAYRVNSGDLLFARSGATVGKVALVRDGDPECVGGAYFIWLRFKNEVNPEYARCVLTSDRIREVIAKQSRQAAQQNFSGPAIRRLPMPIPPRDLQAQFAKTVAQVRTNKQLHERGSAELNGLFESLQHRAFVGAL
jgi:type I restriction enzyme, S subunit